MTNLFEKSLTLFPDFPNTRLVNTVNVDQRITKKIESDSRSPVKQGFKFEPLFLVVHIKEILLYISYAHSICEVKK